MMSDIDCIPAHLLLLDVPRHVYCLVAVIIAPVGMATESSVGIRHRLEQCQKEKKVN